MHIITAENEVGDMHSTILTAKVISELSAIVEHGMEIQLNKESFSYSRFCMHLRYLVQRMMHGSPLDAGNAMDSMFVTMRNEYPQVHACVQRIDTFCTAPTGGSAAKKSSCTSSCISTASALSARRIELFQNQIIRIVTCTLFAGRHPFHAPPRQRPALRPFCGLRSGDFSFSVCPPSGARRRCEI